jgi:hypothetical protein
MRRLNNGDKWGLEIIRDIKILSDKDPATYSLTLLSKVVPIRTATSTYYALSLLNPT